MKLVFNELSGSGANLTVHAARARMSNMVKAIAELAGVGSVTLAAVCNFYEVMVAREYTVLRWLGDDNADRDMRAFLLRASAKIAFDSDISDAVRNRFYLAEFHVGAEEARGLGLAYLLDTVAVSLASEDRWRRTEVVVSHVWLAADASEQRQTVNVLNVSDSGDVESVRQHQLRRTQMELRSQPWKLVERRAVCFPHLEFGREVDEQMGALSGVVRDLVVRKLIVLDGIARDWRRSGADPLTSPLVSRESEATMNEYGRERVFKTADGGTGTFEPHARVGTGHRIHIRLDYENRAMEVGYIGKHLPTKRFRS